MKQPQPIPRQGKHPKRGFAFIDTAKEINVWLYRVKDDSTYVVCDSPNFEASATYYDAKRSDLKDLYQKRKSSISSKPKQLTGEAKNDKEAMNAFFYQLALRMPFLCDNCNKPLKAFTSYAKRSACAHILPKANFKSVQILEENILYMGAAFIGGCGCHDQWDANVGSRIKMNVYQVALERFEGFKHLLTSEEIKQAYTYLNIEWK